MDQSILIQTINKDLETELPLMTHADVLLEKLAVFLNHLIQSDFQKLIFLLYRVDIDEMKLKKLLQDNPDENAGLIIADLVIKREQEKIRSRNEFKKQAGESGEEKW